MTDRPKVALRPFLPADAPKLAAIFRVAVEELTGEDYDADQRDAWASLADDEAAFATRLAECLTLVAVVEGAPAGFIALEDNKHIDLFYVAPEVAGTGVGAALCAAAEAIARGRGTMKLSVDASDTALGFFQKRGFEAQRRNTVEINGVWLGNTSLTKTLDPKAGE